jgi:hypothetical protein
MVRASEMNFDSGVSHHALMMNHDSAQVRQLCEQLEVPAAAFKQELEVRM